MVVVMMTMMAYSFQYDNHYDKLSLYKYENDGGGNNDDDGLLILIWQSIWQALS